MPNRTLLLGALLLLLAALVWGTDRTMVVSEGNLNLSAGSVQRGDLIVLAGNVHVPAGARIDGTLLVMCCNVLLDGEVTGDVHLASGNLALGPGAVVGGAVGTVAANADFHRDAVVEGRQRGPGLVLTLLRAMALAPALALTGLITFGVGALRQRRHDLVASARAEA